MTDVVGWKDGFKTDLKLFLRSFKAVEGMRVNLRTLRRIDMRFGVRCRGRHVWLDMGYSVVQMKAKGGRVVLFELIWNALVLAGVIRVSFHSQRRLPTSTYERRSRRIR